MKKSLLLLTAVTAFCAAAPANAQYSDRYGDRYSGASRYDTNFDVRIQRLRTWVNQRDRAGTLDRREAMSLRRQINDLDQLEQRYRRGGFSGSESADLQNRIQILDQNLQVAHSGSLDRYGRYTQDNYYGRGEPTNYYGRGGPMEDWNGLRIGERAPSDLGRVPYDYGMRYRDRDDVFYRSDGQSIYGIDARTGVVIQVYPMGR